jgi:hypothetical protein
VEKQMECRLAGQTEVLGENLPQRHFCPSQNPTWPDPGLNPGRRGGKLATNCLSYGVAIIEELTRVHNLRTGYLSYTQTVAVLVITDLQQQLIPCHGTTNQFCHEAKNWIQISCNYILLFHIL